MNYYILNTENIQTFLYNIPEIKTYFQNQSLNIEEIGDGNVNFVFIAKSSKTPSKALIIKQAVPYLRCAGEEFPLSKERMTFEIRALQSYEEFVPEYAPKIYHTDEQMSVVVMQYLDDHIIMRKGLIAQQYYPSFSEHISDFLAKTLFYTSSVYLQSVEKRNLMDRFNQNTELCKLTEDFVFTFAYMDHETNFIDPEMQEEAKKLFAEMDFRPNLLKLKYSFMTHNDALLHGDLHTGSIMINEQETFVIDPEFAFYGPFGFDIGALIANLINAYISQIYTTQNQTYMTWILQTIQEIYEKFETKFLTLWNTEAESSLITPGFINTPHLETFKKDFMHHIFQESIGFAGAKIARRVFGIAGVEEIRGIEDPQIRKKASLHALKTGLFLIQNYNTFENSDQLIKTIKELS